MLLRNWPKVPDTARLRRQHAKSYRDFFEPAETRRASLPQAEWLAIYGRHIDNARTGLDWAFTADGDPQIGVALTVAVVPLWMQLWLLGECRERVERAMAEP